MEALENRMLLSVVAAYGFNEGAGTTVGDSSGLGNSGALTSTTWSTAGKFGGALSFNGTSSLVTIADAASLDLTTGMTLEAWVRPTTVNNAWRDVIYKGDDVYFLEATSTSSSRPAGGVRVGTSNLETFGTAALTTSTWAHLALTYDGATLRLYVNGTQVSTAARSGTIQTSNNPLQIGGDSLYGQRFAGLIDEVRVYNNALTPAQIQADMNTPIATDSVLPTAPSNLGATAASTSQINLSWTAATDNIGVTGYRVERQNPGSSSFTQVATPAGTTFSNTGLTANSTYSYRVRAVDGAGNLGPYSNVATATTQADTQLPTAPANLGATSVSTTQINLSWTAATDNVGVTGYRVERQDPGSSSFTQIATPTGTTFNNTGLTASSTYSYRVRAVDGAGNLGPYSNVATTTTQGGDVQPPSVSITGPANGSTVSHVVTVSATASDNTGVSSVQFFADGVSLGTDTTAPYSVNWNSTTAANGTHSLTAVARDTAGNQATSGASVTTANPAFVNEIVVPGITSATTIAFLPDGRMLVGDLTNKIWVVQAGANQPDPTPFLNLDYSQLFGEQGLMDVVLDPSFAQNNYYYVFYTKGFSGQHNRDTLSRFTASGNGTVPNSEFVLWQDAVDANAEHHGGSIAFGQDGKLYFTVGDHFDYPSAQDLTSYHGKVLRINLDGTIPTDNPFYDGNGPNRDAIWAYGLRNPFRMSIDPVTGRMYIGDVGGNTASSSIEEINLGIRGANYGWPLVEGNGGGAGLTSPIYSYPHSGRDAAVTGGFVYRGNQFPSEYYGSYFFGDYVQNTMKRLTFDAAGNVTNVLNFWPADGSTDGPTLGDPVKFLQGPDGSIYYVDIGFNDQHVPNDAAIRRIRYTLNQPPVAVASANPLTGLPPLTVDFSSAGSFDPDGTTLTYAWTFGDGTTSTAANPSHTYQSAGRYVARLAVSDGVNSTLSSDVIVQVGRPPIPVIGNPTNGLTFRAGDVINYSGSATDPDEGTLPASTFSWSILFHHDSHVHPAGGPFTGTTSGTLTIPTSGHSFEGATNYEIVLTVTDSTGLTASTSVTVYPEKVNLSFDSVPSGLTLAIDGLNKQTPFVLDDVIGFQHTISAPTQTVGGTTYAFTSWSDGGGLTHGIVTPTFNQNYVATFQATQTTLVAAYGFNEGAGGTVADSSGSGNTGTLTSTTWSTAGKSGGALSFNGTSSLATIADAASLDLTTGMTLEAWVRPSTVNSAWRDVIYKGDDVYFLEATSTSASRPAGGVKVGTSNLETYGTAALAVNTWSHLALTYDGATLRLYVNGTQVSSAARTGAIQTSTNPLQIGGDSLYGQRFAGLIDEVRIYNKALTASEIQTDMNTAIGSTALLQAQTLAASGATPVKSPAVSAPVAASQRRAELTALLSSAAMLREQLFSKSNAGQAFATAAAVRINDVETSVQSTTKATIRISQTSAAAAMQQSLDAAIVRFTNSQLASSAETRPSKLSPSQLDSLWTDAAWLDDWFLS